MVKTDNRAVHLARLAHEGSEELAERVVHLLDLYPALNDRPLKAGEMVSEYRVWLGPGVIGRVQRDNGVWREVCFVNGHFTCTCEDFQFNLKAIQVADGSYQQPCAHILAVVLYTWEMWGPVFVKEEK